MPRWLTICGGLLAVACGADRTADVASPPAPVSPATTASCPSIPVDTTTIPDVDAAHRDVATWLAKLAPGQAEAVLVDPERLDPLNRRFSEVTGAWRDPTASETADPVRIEGDIVERLAYLRQKVDAGELVQNVPGSMAEADALAREAVQVDQLRLVIQESPLHCVPLQSGLFKPPIDEAFDRNRCASLHPGEMVRVLRRAGAGDWLYVHAGYVVGWLHEPVLTPRLDRDQLDRWQSGRRLVPLRDEVATRDGFRLRLGTSFPLVRREDEGYLVLVPTAEGLKETAVPVDAPVHVGFAPLSRRALWTLALSELDSPYGWGGRAGERDCSRYLRDAFATFGLQLARHSGVQAQLGTHNVDVSGMTEPEKLAAIEHWAQRGVLLLYMPGHIMLYLGRDGPHHYGVSSMSEFLEPCAGGPDTVRRVDRVAVTTLELGRDTERTAFIERITRVVVFAPEHSEARVEASASTRAR